MENQINKLTPKLQESNNMTVQPELLATLKDTKQMENFKQNCTQKTWMKFVGFLYRNLLSLRYDVKIEGTENLKNDGPILLLPNHPGIIDPQILFSNLVKYLNISPVVTDRYYDAKSFNWLFKSMGAVRMTDLTKDSTNKDNVKQSFIDILNALSEGKNVLIYPSGQIYSQGEESIIGKQTVFNILKDINENQDFDQIKDKIRIIGIKTKGLWGSRWSKAWTGKTPTFVKELLQGSMIMLANLFFFTPKRKVSIMIEDLTKQIKETILGSDLNTFNKQLENFYNSDGEELATYVPHYFYYNDVKDKQIPSQIDGSLKQLSQKNTNDISLVPQDIQQKICSKISDMKGFDQNKISPDSNLILDLMFDSLDLAEIKSYVQSSFQGSSNPPILDLKTVSDLYVMAIGKSTTQESLKPCNRSELADKSDLVDELNSLYPEFHTKQEAVEYFEKNDLTILSLLKKSFKKDMNMPFVYDNVLGMQTRKEFMLKAYLISDYIKKIDGKYVGIMLPSLASSSLLIVACYLAQKVPVMLNWTLGETSFDHCVNFSKTNAVLSSKKFFDKVKNPGLEKHMDKMMFLEDMLKDIPLTKKLGALLNSKLFRLPKLDKEAVVLYTSGSESLPKAVVLSHMNIVENIRSALNLFKIKRDDVMIGFLPPFHSFGFTINTILPLLTGLRIAYTPDPNDSKTIANMVQHCKVTTLTATPTFLNMIMKNSNPDDLKTLKYAVVGAEKCSQETFDKFKSMSDKSSAIIEGYGITECSPVISLNPLSAPKLGSVGKAIKGADIRILGVEDSVEVENTKQGMIYVKANSIFDGYIDDKLESPFQTIDGEIYYKTGDLGYLDNEGYLYITGRLKRFVKIAGEMISLPFVESVLNKDYGTDVVIEASEDNGNVKIIAFGILDIGVENLNQTLRNNGVSNLIKISEYRKIDQIPVLGTGKTDYKTLKSMI